MQLNIPKEIGLKLKKEHDEIIEDATERARELNTKYEALKYQMHEDYNKELEELNSEMKLKMTMLSLKTRMHDPEAANYWLEPKEDGTIEIVGIKES